MSVVHQVYLAWRPCKWTVLMFTGMHLCACMPTALGMAQITLRDVRVWQQDVVSFHAEQTGCTAWYYLYLTSYHTCRWQGHLLIGLSAYHSGWQHLG